MSISKTSIKLTLTLNKVFLYLGCLKLIVCHPGRAVHMGVFLPCWFHSLTWKLNEIRIQIQHKLQKEKYLFLNQFNTLIMFLGSWIELENNPAACQVVNVINKGERKQEKANKDPSVVNQDVSQPRFVSRIFSGLGFLTTMSIFSFATRHRGNSKTGPAIGTCDWEVDF